MENLCKRYVRLPTMAAAVADVLDRKGFRKQVLAKEIKPMRDDMKVAGPAFTIKGISSPEFQEDEEIWKMLDTLTPTVVAIIDTSDTTDAATWGELMSTAARGKGCQGVVTDGGVRDTEYILKLNFPTFARFRIPTDSTRRFFFLNYQKPIYMGGVTISPGDFVVGDMDGVVIVPEDLTQEVIVEAEKTEEREKKMRQELLEGKPILETYRKYTRPVEELRRQKP